MENNWSEIWSKMKTLVHSPQNRFAKQAFYRCRPAMNWICWNRATTALLWIVVWRFFGLACLLPLYFNSDQLIVDCNLIVTNCCVIIALAQRIKTGCNKEYSGRNDSLLNCNGHCRKEMTQSCIETIRIRLQWHKFNCFDPLQQQPVSLQACTVLLQHYMFRNHAAMKQIRAEAMHCCAAGVIAEKKRFITALKRSLVRLQQLTFSCVGSLQYK